MSKLRVQKLADLDAVTAEREVFMREIVAERSALTAQMRKVADKLRAYGQRQFRGSDLRGELAANALADMVAEEDARVLAVMRAAIGETGAEQLVAGSLAREDLSRATASLVNAWWCPNLI